MKSLVFISFLAFLGFHAVAQNKTLGVGVTTPNPNAVLDVNSPTHNQGILIPRLTTTERTAMAASLDSDDIGMLVFDITTNTMVVWNGTAWGISIGGASTNSAAAVFGTTTGTGPAGYFQNTNPANTNPALYGTTNGGGLAMAIRGDITNAANTSAAVYGGTVGSGVGVYGISSGTGAAIQGYTATASTAIYGQRDGASNGNAGLFNITNPANSFSALQSTTIGTGSVATFEINNAANGSPVLNLISNGTGNAITANRPIQATSFVGDGSALTNLPTVSFPLTSASSATLPLFTLTNSGTGSAGQFLTTNAATASDALVGTSNATAGFSAIHGTHSGGGLFTDAGVKGESTGAASGITGITNGTGAAGYFNTFTSSNTNPTVRVVNNGLGSAATFTIFQATNSSTVLNATNNSSSSGGAGMFNLTSATNSGIALTASTSGVGGVAEILSTNATNSAPALNISHSGTGNAITANRPIQATSFIGDGSGLTGLPGTFSTVNAIPKGNGSILTSSLLFDDGTNVGIGTASPSGLLHLRRVLANGTESPFLIMDSGNGLVNSGTSIQFRDSNTDAGFYSAIAGIDDFDKDGRLEFRVSNNGVTDALPLTAADTKMVLVQSGNVGIGTMSPTQKLEVSGTVLATAFQGDGSALTNIPGGFSLPYLNSSASGSNLIDITSTGGGSVGNFIINNISNTSPAIWAETNGDGGAILARATGTSQALKVQFQNSSGGSNAMDASTNGIGSVAGFSASNASNSSPAISISHSGTGNAINANAKILSTISGTVNTNALEGSTSSTNGRAGYFTSTNTSNVFPALEVANGTNGNAATFTNSNTSNPSNTIALTNSGLGRGAYISLSQAGNSQPALEINHSGTGNAITANKPIQTNSLISTGNIVIGPTSETISAPSSDELIFSGYLNPLTDNAYQVGQTGKRWSSIYAVSGTINTSDARQKKDITDLKYGLAEILKLRPVSFIWKTGNGTTKLGLIAQEAVQVLPEVVDVPKREEDQYGMFYSDIIPVLIKGMQEQQAIIENLKTENTKLNAEVAASNDKQAQEIALLKKQMEKIMQTVGAEAKKD